MSGTGKGAKKTGGKGFPAPLKGVGKGKKKAGLQPPVGPARTVYKRAAKVERVAVQAVMACDVKKLIASRKDKKLLGEHILAILTHKAKYEARLQVARTKAAEFHAIPAHKAKITEAVGEYESTLLMIQQYVKANGGDDYVIVNTFSAGIGIDQIWYSKGADTFILVEAKGPGAMLSTGAAKGDQMSKQWVRASLDQASVGKNTPPADKERADRMLDAMDNGPPPRVLGRVIEAIPGGGAKEVGCPDKGIYHAT